MRPPVELTMEVAHQEVLLAIARRAIEDRLAKNDCPAPTADAPTTPTYGGVFVSLHNGRHLRGCVGRLQCDGTPLSQLVHDIALAALQDPRFESRPVTLLEMPQILIELSLLSPMRRTSDPLEMEVGVHGIYVRRGIFSGCFLPQVALHMSWDRHQMLSRCCCDKAGLAADAWRDPETEVYLFTAEVFAERPR